MVEEGVSVYPFWVVKDVFSPDGVALVLLESLLEDETGVLLRAVVAVVVRAELVVVAQSAALAPTVLSRAALVLARLLLRLLARLPPLVGLACVAVHPLPWSSDYTYIYTTHVKCPLRSWIGGHTR